MCKRCRQRWQRYRLCWWRSCRRHLNDLDVPCAPLKDKNRHALPGPTNCLRPSSPKTTLYHRRLIRVLLKQSLTLFARGIRTVITQGTDLCRSKRMAPYGSFTVPKPAAAAHFAYAALACFSVKPWHSRWKSDSPGKCYDTCYRQHPRIRPFQEADTLRQEFPCDIFAVPKSFLARKFRHAQ